jgi:hypothetical protein
MGGARRLLTFKKIRYALQHHYHQPCHRPRYLQPLPGPAVICPHCLAEGFVRWLARVFQA